MRTCGLVLLSTNFTFAVLLHAFMCWRIRLRRFAGGLSRKPTVRRTPPAPQYFVTTTARRSAVGLKSRMTLVSRAIGALFIGLMSIAVRAAWTNWSCGNLLGKQTITF